MDALVYNDTGLSINQQLSNIKGDLTAANVLGNTLLSNTTAYAGSLNTHIKALEGVTDELDGRVETLEGFYDAIDNMADSDNGAWLHNMFGRRKNLGESLTSDQIARIADGTFKGIFPGDYWEKTITFNFIDCQDSDKTISMTGKCAMTVLECNYWTLSEVGNKNHVMVMFTPYHPSSVSGGFPKGFFGKMNDSATNAGGYYGSKMRSTYLTGAKNAFNAFFGSSHIFTHADYLCNAVTNGVPTGYVNKTDLTVELMSVQMIKGNYAGASQNDGTNNMTVFEHCKTHQAAAFKKFKFSDFTNKVGGGTWTQDTFQGTGFVMVKASGNSVTAGGHSNANTVYPMLAYALIG